MTIKLLDCTLRDGGYVNAFSFSVDTVKAVIKNLVAAGVDYIECGFLKNVKQTTETTVFLSADDLKDFVPENKKKSKLFVMIVFGTFDIEKLPPRKDVCFDGIRVTFKKKEISEALSYLKKIRELGYIVSANPTGIHSYSDMELLKLLEQVNDLQPDIFSIVDTLGVMNATDLLKKFYLVENNLNEGTIIGFHSHNNLQLSFSNSQELIGLHSNRDIIIDSCVMGMGRGAGNLNTELMISHLNENYDAEYDLLPILKIADEHISKIFARTPWGYNLPYFLAASVKCHPNYASYLIDKQTISVEAINAILLRIPDDRKSAYDEELIKRLYLDYQENAVDDEAVINALKTQIDARPVLIVSPGKSLNEKHNEIINFIITKKPFVIATNFRPDKIKADKVFISNAKRFAEQKDLSDVIVTSNIKTDVSTLNYASYLNNSEMYDNSVLMLLAVLMKLGIREVYAAGLDGFANNDNYADPQMINNAKLGEFDKRNQIMRQMIKRFDKQIHVHFITPSLYEENDA